MRAAGRMIWFSDYFDTLGKMQQINENEHWRTLLYGYLYLHVDNNQLKLASPIKHGLYLAREILTYTISVIIQLCQTTGNKTNQVITELRNSVTLHIYMCKNMYVVNNV